MADGRIERWMTENGLALLGGWARQGLDRKTIAGKMGVAPSTLARWEKREEGIATALACGRELADALVENALYQKALGGDLRAMTFWLRNRMPERWRDNPDVKGGQVVNIIDDL